MTDKLADTLSEIKIRDYDEDTMSKEDIEKIQKFVPPIVFRWMQYPDAEDFELEVKYLLDINEEGALYTPWTGVPAFMMELIDGNKIEEEVSGTMQ